MSRKVINIERAKIDRDRPLLAMTTKERTAVFHDLGGSIYEGILNEAGEKGKAVRLICVVLSEEGARDRFVSSFEEYGDKDHVDLCEDIIEDLTPFLHRGERLRIATFDVDLDRLEPFKFPSKKLWHARENDNEDAARAWRLYGQLHEARGVPTIVITWLIGPGKSRKIVTWDVDHGDGCGRYEYTANTIEGMRWNKLIPKGGRLQALTYKVPMSALHERDGNI